MTWASILRPVTVLSALGVIGAGATGLSLATSPHLTVSYAAASSLQSAVQRTLGASSFTVDEVQVYSGSSTASGQVTGSASGISESLHADYQAPDRLAVDISANGSPATPGLIAIGPRLYAELRSSGRYEVLNQPVSTDAFVALRQEAMSSLYLLQSVTRGVVRDGTRFSFIKSMEAGVPGSTAALSGVAKGTVVVLGGYVSTVSVVLSVHSAKFRTVSMSARFSRIGSSVPVRLP